MTHLWSLAALALLAGYVPCAWVVARGKVMDRFVGVQLAGQLTALVLFCTALASDQPGFADLAIVLVLLSFIASLLFAHFFERWL